MLHIHDFLCSNFCFFMICFKLQIIKYAESIPFINFYKNFSNRKKWHKWKMQDMQENEQIYGIIFFFLDTLYWWSYSKCWYENRCLDSGYNTRGIQGQHSAYNSTSPGHHHGQWSCAGHEGGKSGRVQLPISAVKGFTLSLL